MQKKTLVTLNRTIRVMHGDAVYSVDAFVGTWLRWANGQHGDTAEYKLWKVFGKLPNGATSIESQNFPTIVLKVNTIVSEQEVD